MATPRMPIVFHNEEVHVDPSRIAFPDYVSQKHRNAVLETWTRIVGHTNPFMADADTLHRLWHGFAFNFAGATALNSAIDPNEKIKQVLLRDSHVYDALQIDDPDDLLVAPQTPLILVLSNREIASIDIRVGALKNFTFVLENSHVHNFLAHALPNEECGKFHSSLFSFGEMGWVNSQFDNVDWNNFHISAVMRGSRFSGTVRQCQLRIHGADDDLVDWSHSTFQDVALFVASPGLILAHSRLESVHLKNSCLSQLDLSYCEMRGVIISATSIGHKLELRGSVALPKEKRGFSDRDEDIDDVSLALTTSSLACCELDASASKLTNFELDVHAERSARFDHAEYNDGCVYGSLTKSTWLDASLQDVTFGGEYACDLSAADFRTATLQNVKFADNSVREGILVPPDCPEAVRNVLD